MVRIKFFFNANSRSQISALRRAGVKNVMLTHKYVQNRAKEFSNEFEDVILGPGFNNDKQKYHEFIQDWDFKVLQYDSPQDPMENYRNFEEGLQYNENIIPILHKNYLQTLSLYKPNYKGSLYALGKCDSRDDEDSQLRRLPTKYQYHGLAKGRWIKRNISSIDSSTWTSGVRGRKTDVWKSQSIYFGRKGQSNTSQLQIACQKNLIYLSKIGIDPKEIVQGEKSALQLAPIALYFMPAFKDLGFYRDNFKY